MCAHEGPQLGDLPWLAALDGSPARAIHHSISQRKAHGDSCVVDSTFTPGFRQVTLLKPDAGDRVDDPATCVFRELFGKIGKHFRRYLRAECTKVFRRKCGLDLAKQSL